MTVNILIVTRKVIYDETNGINSNEIILVKRCSYDEASSFGAELTEVEGLLFFLLSSLLDDESSFFFFSMLKCKTVRNKLQH